MRLPIPHQYSSLPNASKYSAMAKGTSHKNQLSPKVQNSALRAHGSLWTWTANLEDVSVFTPNERKIRGFECYQYASPTADPVVSQVELNEWSLRNWLDSKTPLINEEQPCGGYKILQFDANTSEDVPMKEEDYIAMNEAFGLPPVGLHISTQKQGACGMFHNDDDSFGINHVLAPFDIAILTNYLVFVHRPPWLRCYMTTVLRYNPTTNITVGYIFTDFDDDEDLGFLNHMHYQFLTCPHPLLLPVLIDEIALEMEVNQIVNRNDTLNDLEAETGFSSKRASTSDRAAVPMKTSDYQNLVTRVGEEQSYFLANSIALASIKMALQSHLKSLQRLETILPEESKVVLRRPSIQLNDRLEYILSGLEHTVVHGNVDYRYKSLQTVVRILHQRFSVGNRLTSTAVIQPHCAVRQ